MKLPAYRGLLARWRERRGASPRPLVNVDSSTALLEGLARCLHGRGFPRLGSRLPVEPVIGPMNRLPESVKQSIYRWAGWVEAIPPRKARTVEQESIARWLVHRYPARPYPVVALGSSNGAAIHLCAAMGIPWLPQNFLVNLRHPPFSPDDVGRHLQLGREPGRELLHRNPEVQLHQMADPIQDRLMLQRISYFRIKWITLPSAYAAFMEQVLKPGGTVLVIDCAFKWLTTQVGHRHYFQLGGFGGLTDEAYLHPDHSTEAFIQRQGSSTRRWQSLRPDHICPEAEWGYAPKLNESVVELAIQQGWNVKWLRFEQPEDLSDFVAELYVWWYERRGVPTRRIVAENFILIDPWWSLRVGAVPYWTVFNSDSSARRLGAYLQEREFDELFLALFSHGIKTPGLASMDQWQELLQSVPQGAFLGADPSKYPADFKSFIGYHKALSQLSWTPTQPAPLQWREFEAFCSSDRAVPGVSVHSCAPLRRSERS